MTELADWAFKLGPAGVLAVATYVLWLERRDERKRNEQLWALLMAEKQARVDDAKLGTTAMLTFAEQFSDAREGSKHD